jgi:hypothetical protein
MPHVIRAARSCHSILASRAVNTALTSRSSCARSHHACSHALAHVATLDGIDSTRDVHECIAESAACIFGPNLSLRFTDNVAHLLGPVVRQADRTACRRPTTWHAQAPTALS